MKVLVVSDTHGRDESLETVSYTHLDVYKRQSASCMASGQGNESGKTGISGIHEKAF